MTRTPLTLGAVALVLALTAACSGDAPAESSGADDDVVVLTPPDEEVPEHDHATTVGDGTRPKAGGYRLADVRLPQQLREPGQLSFTILDRDGEPLLDYEEEQTKLLHLYVVSADLQDFRHLHPTMDEQGVWTARVTVNRPGPHRLLAEFVPGGSETGDHVALGQRVMVDQSAGDSTDPVAAAVDFERVATADDGVVRITAPEQMQSGPDQEMRLMVSSVDGGPVNLGSYLGSYAHVTGFEAETGAFAHTHPIGSPEVTEDGNELLFHTAFETTGTYRFFVQVRVDGFVHQVPVVAEVV